MELNLNQEIIQIGKASDLTEEQNKALVEKIHELKPWKKGPYNLFGNHIDSEWRCDFKWDRMQGIYGPLEGKVVADVGSNNGYYSFRMLNQNPKKIICFDPVEKIKNQFDFLNSFIKTDVIEFKKEGVDDLVQYPDTFDTIFCLGLIYHRRDPVKMLEVLKGALKKKGQLVLESQGIEGELPICLTPRSRYAGAAGMWFLPTAKCLEHWLLKTGFQHIKIHGVYPQTIDEQRRTEFADFESLKDFMSEDLKTTVEGYPPPVRIFVTAKKSQ